MAHQYGDSGSIYVQMAGPVGGSGGAMAKLTNITLLASAWKGAESPYSQVVDVDAVSVNSMVNLQPSVEQLEIFHDKDISFTTENDGGIVTVYVIGDKPQDDYIIQATILEVIA